MQIEFKKSYASARLAVLVNGKIAFETYNLSRNEWGKFCAFIEDLQRTSFDEGMLCQRERALTDAISRSKESMGEAQQPPSASTPQGNRCVLAENLSIAPAGVGDERGQGEKPR